MVKKFIGSYKSVSDFQLFVYHAKKTSTSAEDGINQRRDFSQEKREKQNHPKLLARFKIRSTPMIKMIRSHMQQKDNKIKRKPPQTYTSLG